MSDNSDLDRISDLCLNYESPYNKTSDQIRVLQMEVKILLERIDSIENQNKQYKRALESI